MTGDEILEEPSGIINGTNFVFFTSLAYQPTTLRLWLNGMLIRSIDDDGPIEINPSTGEFHIKIPPRNTDTIQVRYLEA